jgi:hypothetical protein
MRAVTTINEKIRNDALNTAEIDALYDWARG